MHDHTQRPTPDDDNRVVVLRVGDKIVMDFGALTSWVELNPAKARHIGQSLITQANLIQGEANANNRIL